MTAWEGHAPVGSAAFVPGTVTRGRLTLAEHIDGPVSAPVMIAAGARAGRVLWPQAAIHSGEVGGTIALARLLARLDLSPPCHGRPQPAVESARPAMASRAWLN